MKRFIIIATLFIGCLQMSAQKFAYIDSEYVLRHIPAYTEAQAELNQLASDWQEEIEQKYANIVLLEEAYKAEKILLPGEMQKKRESEIKTRKEEARQMQKDKFGVGGELFTKREELIQPIQEEIYQAIADVCASKGYMVIFDKSNNSNMLYTNPKFDVSDKVIRKMGLTPGDVQEQAQDEGDKGGDTNTQGNDKGGGDKGNTEKRDKK